MSLTGARSDRRLSSLLGEGALRPSLDDPLDPCVLATHSERNFEFVFQIRQEVAAAPGKLVSSAPKSDCARKTKEASKKSSAPYFDIVKHLAVVAVLASLFFGCAPNAREPTSDARIWAAQLARQQEGARENGRIGWVGYDGPGSQ